MARPPSRASPAAGGREGCTREGPRRAPSGSSRRWLEDGPEGSAGDPPRGGDHVQGRGRVPGWVSGRPSAWTWALAAVGGPRVGQEGNMPPGESIAQTLPGLAVSPPAPAPPLLRPSALQSRWPGSVWVGPDLCRSWGSSAGTDSFSTRNTDLRCPARSYLQLMLLCIF